MAAPDDAEMAPTTDDPAVSLDGLEGFIHSPGKMSRRLLAYFNEKSRFAIARSLGDRFELVSIGDGVFGFRGLVSKNALLRVLNNELIGRYVTRIYWADQQNTRRDAIVAKVVEALAGQRAKVRIQAHPSEAAQQFATLFPEEFALGASGFTHVLSAVFINRRGQKRYYWGLIPAAEHYRQNTAPRPDGDVCSARFKLREVFFVFGISPEPTWRILDVGAAPGSWTLVLSRLVPAGRVVAVDPAELSEECLRCENVVHLRKRVEDCADELRAHGPFDAVTCDANVDPRHLSSALDIAIGLLREGGVFILTLKCFDKLSKHETVSESRDIYVQKFDRVETVWLLANTVHERTLVGWKKRAQ